MAMSDYERLKRWREKHPVLAKLRRKEAYRKSKEPVEEEIVEPETVAVPKSKIEVLRALVAGESAKPAQAVVETPPPVRRDDYGRVLTEGQWEQLQERKSKAAGAGYVLDEFSQQ